MFIVWGRKAWRDSCFFVRPEGGWVKEGGGGGGGGGGPIWPYLYCLKNYQNVKLYSTHFQFIVRKSLLVWIFVLSFLNHCKIKEIFEIWYVFNSPIKLCECIQKNSRFVQATKHNFQIIFLERKCIKIGILLRNPCQPIVEAATGAFAIHHYTLCGLYPRTYLTLK